DCLEKLPSRLERYGAVLLADEALAEISVEDVLRVRSFAEHGGRLILPCNAFFPQTLAKANEILAGHGFPCEPKHMSGLHITTNIIADALTIGVNRLEFFRPSPIVVEGASKGKALALDPKGPGAFVAIARTDGGGEIIVLADSLWWAWVGSFKDKP